MSKNALGQGLGALISGASRRGAAAPVLAPGATAPPAAPPAAEIPATDRVVRVPLSAITASPMQPRKHFREEQLTELMDSIREHGIIQPVICTKQGDAYRLVVGERRCRASRMAGLTSVPVIIEEMTESKLLQVALIENLQREDLDPIETALAYSHLLREHNLTQEELAQLVGASRETVNKALADFAGRNWIRLDGRAVLIIDLDRLSKRGR